jgi:hypothetical protein
MISGQFGQPTILGFAVFVTGLALAAMPKEIVAPVIAETPSQGSKVAIKPVRGRSAYAERLHGPSATPERSNGSVAR